MWNCWFFGKQKIDQFNIHKTLKLMKNRGPDFSKNRGPDFSNYFNTNINNELNLCLLHSRLSIIDLKERSNQPFIQDGNVLVFNGEIYNYLELRKNLIDLGWC